MRKVPEIELTNRMNRFVSAMNKAHPDWEVCMLVGHMSIYYLTGTICDGVLFIQRDKNTALWVRKSYQRAVLESEFHDIRPMLSFRELANHAGVLPKTLYLDMAAATLEWYEILSKHMKFDKVLPVDKIMLDIRSVKSQYEINLMSRAGAIVERILKKDLPSALYSGLSEAELGAELYKIFIKNGYHGLIRFSMRNTEVVLGHIGFSESSLYPSVFDGASGLVGLSPAAPVLGSPDVRLKEGDLIYIDVGFGVDGYNVDKTIVYSFLKQQPDYVNDVHRHCLELEKRAVSMLCAGAKPSDIYNTIYKAVRPELRDSFMGISGHTAKFLGHGIGLYIDEQPVIARGVDDPLKCDMTIAIEPKIGIEGIGMVGSENTYLITESGAVSLTGEMNDILLV